MVCGLDWVRVTLAKDEMRARRAPPARAANLAVIRRRRERPTCAVCARWSSGRRHCTSGGTAARARRRTWAAHESTDRWRGTPATGDRDATTRAPALRRASVDELTAQQWNLTAPAVACEEWAGRPATERGGLAGGSGSGGPSRTARRALSRRAGDRGPSGAARAGRSNSGFERADGEGQSDQEVLGRNELYRLECRAVDRIGLVRSDVSAGRGRTLRRRIDGQPDQ